MNKEIIKELRNKAWENYKKNSSIGCDSLFSGTNKQQEQILKKEKHLKIISWIASIFSLIGILLNAFKLIYCWPIWIIGNLLWVYWSFKKSEWSQFILWLVFEATNIFAWYQWTML